MTKSELIQKQYSDLSDQDRRKFNRWLGANVAIASLFSIALLAMALASGLYSVGPRSATAEGSHTAAALIARFPVVDSEILSGENVTKAAPVENSKLAGRKFSKECAARDLQAITDIEDYGNSGTVPSEKLVAAHAMMLDARDQCRISETEGLRIYGAIDLTVTHASAK